MNTLGLDIRKCSYTELEDIINSNLPYFRSQFMQFYFENNIDFEEIVNWKLGMIEEYDLKTTISNKEIYYMTLEKFKFLPTDINLYNSLSPSLSLSDYPNRDFELPSSTTTSTPTTPTTIFN